MADKYLSLSGNDKIEVEATDSSAGAGDAGEIVALDAAGLIALNMLPVGVGPDVKNLASFENLSAGDLVNVFNDGGTEKVRKADATTAGKEADGFVLAAVTAPTAVDVYFEGVLTGLSGLTRGAKQFLDTTAGGLTETAPTTTGNIYQFVGRAVSDTELAFESGEGITRA
jgi:hypothetical protein